MQPLGSKISRTTSTSSIPGAGDTPAKGKVALQEPNAPRTGGIRRPSGRSLGLFVATAVTAAILATGLPMGNGAAIAQTTDVAATEQVAPINDKRHIEGEVFADGSGAYWLNITSDEGVSWYDGSRYEAVFLGDAGSEMAGRLDSGDQLVFDGRTVARDDGEGGLRLEFLETKSLERTTYAGSDPTSPAAMPRFDGRKFVDGRYPLPQFEIKCTDGVRDMVVLNREGTMAYTGQIPADASEFTGLTGTHAVTEYLHGGPSFDVKDGQVAHPDSGELLRELSVKKDGEGNLQSGWFLHEAENYNSLVHLNFENGADTARADKTIVLDTVPAAPALDDLKKN